MSRINKLEYRKARQLVRENGYCALRWLSQSAREVMESLRDINNQSDHLAERASIVAYCALVGAECNVRHTQARTSVFLESELYGASE